MLRELVAIDPGPTESAYAILRGDGAVLDKGKLPNRELLGIRWKFSLTEVAIEAIASYGMAVGKEVFETCIWVGRFLERFSGCFDQVRLIYRAEVKMHLCKSMKAKDGNIRQALIDKFGPPGTKKNPGKLYGFAGDMWAALGVAVTAMETVAPPENLRR